MADEKPSADSEDLAKRLRELQARVNQAAGGRGRRQPASFRALETSGLPWSRNKINEPFLGKSPGVNDPELVRDIVSKLYEIAGWTITEAELDDWLPKATPPSPPSAPPSSAPPRRRLRWKLAGAALAIASTSALVGFMIHDKDETPSPGPTSPNSNPAVTPADGRYWVLIHTNAPGRAHPKSTLAEGRNYVFCRVWGPKVQFSDGYNHWWLKTDMDDGKVDFVSAYYLSGWSNDIARDEGGQEIPICPPGESLPTAG